MNLVTITNLTHQYSERVLFDDAELLVNTGNRIGLIGINGSGKTTLLRIVAGQEVPDGGQVTVWGGVRIRAMWQNPILDPEKSVLETVFDSDAPQLRLLQEYEHVNLQLQRTPADQALQARFNALLEKMDRQDGWAAEANAKAILTRMDITAFDAKLGTLSGGQEKRVALAQALIDPGDLLILDEPTNHIDADTIDWLESFLLEMDASLLMVTHDRYFLDRVANRIVELDRRKLINYPGNYSKYLELRQRRHLVLKAQEEKRSSLLRRELEWLRRGAMARSTKQKARKQRIEALQRIHYDAGEQRVAMLLAGARLGKRVLEAHNLSKRYGEHILFEQVELDLVPGDRIGLVGPNGVGKSTLLDILAGVTMPDEGSVSWGSTVRLGYYDQHGRQLPRERKVIDFLNDVSPLVRTDSGQRVEAAQMLDWFLFPRPQQQAMIASLSGGEQRRLYLLSVLARQPNVLLLDEPTNDLDIQTLQVVEEFLDHFQGSLIVVSHDRYFLDRNVDFLATFEAGSLSSRYPTPFDAFQRARTDELGNAQPADEEKPEAPREEKRRERRIGYMEKRELANLEEQLAELEQRQQSLRAAMQQHATDYLRLQELTTELEQVDAEVDTLMERWLELSELASS